MSGRYINCSTSICWDCARAAGARMCSWSAELKPVEGWEAEPAVVRIADGNDEPTWAVKRCPQFTRDLCEADRDPRRLDTDGCIALLEKATALARNDYIKNPSQRGIIGWWLSGNAVMLSAVKRQAAEYDERRKKKRSCHDDCRFAQQCRVKESIHLDPDHCGEYMHWEDMAWDAECARRALKEEDERKGEDEDGTE